MIVYTTSPSTTLSSTPVTVMVCGSSQFVVVKISNDGLTVPSLVSLLERVINTSSVGWLFSTTVNWAVPPASVVTSPAVGLTVIPGLSLSVLVTLTSAGSTSL